MEAAFPRIRQITTRNKHIERRITYLDLISYFDEMVGGRVIVAQPIEAIQ